MTKVQIAIVKGSILDVDVQVIVNEAKSHGAMGGEVAGVIHRAVGDIVEQEAIQQSPIPIGTAILTSGGETTFLGIIHAPTMPEPAIHIPTKNIARATQAALQLADNYGFTSMAIPGMGTGVGGVSPTDAAAHMLCEIFSFSPQTLDNIILVDIDPAIVQAWRDRV